jgi:hypothetical protein
MQRPDPVRVLGLQDVLHQFFPMKKMIFHLAAIGLLFGAGCAVSSAPSSAPWPIANSSEIQTRKWSGAVDKMPIGAPRFHLLGEIYVGNEGIEVTLSPAAPAGISPPILILELSLVQHPGYFPQRLKWVEVRYDEIPAAAEWTEVRIRYNGQIVEVVPVKTVY